MKATDEFFNLSPTPSVTGVPGAVHGIMDESYCWVAQFHLQVVFGGFYATLLVVVLCIEMFVVIGGFCDGICVFTRVVGEVATAQITPVSPLFPYYMWIVGLSTTLRGGGLRVVTPLLFPSLLFPLPPPPLLPPPPPVLLVLLMSAAICDDSCVASWLIIAVGLMCGYDGTSGHRDVAMLWEHCWSSDDSRRTPVDWRQPVQYWIVVQRVALVVQQLGLRVPPIVPAFLGVASSAPCHLRLYHNYRCPTARLFSRYNVAWTVSVWCPSTSTDWLIFRCYSISPIQYWCYWSSCCWTDFPWSDRSLPRWSAHRCACTRRGVIWSFWFRGQVLF